MNVLMQTTPPPPDNPEDARNHRHLALLAELAELTMSIARKTAAEVMEEKPAEPGAPLTRPAAIRRTQFERLAKSLRDTIALERRIADGQSRRRETKSAAAAQQILQAGPADGRKPPPGLAGHDDLSLISRRFQKAKT